MHNTDIGSNTHLFVIEGLLCVVHHSPTGIREHQVQTDHPQQAPAGLLPRQAAAGLSARDPWIELEAAVERLARIVLHANALAERPRPEPADPDRPQRLARLQDGLDLTRRALLVAARLERVPAAAR